MKKIIKRFALFPININYYGICYTIWFTNYYEEYTLTEKWVTISQSPTMVLPNGNSGKTGSAELTYEWKLTNISQWIK